jgi:GNAT superfamily N-acetyltransferase
VSAQPGSSVEFRPASEDDLEAEFAVFSAAVGELRTRRGAPFQPAPFDPFGRWARVHRHLLEHDGERAFVACQDGRVIGFSAALVRGDCWFFSALFIDPAHQGKGVGRRLLELAWGPSHRRRITITEAIQPVSTLLYSRRGLLPVTPVLAFTGRPRIEADNDGFERASATPGALRVIDLAAYGFPRDLDHEFWSRTSAPATVWMRDGEPCAYSYPGLWGVGPVAGRDSVSAGHALRAELAARSAEEIRVDIPGTATALVRVALDAGLRLDDPGLLLLSPPDPPPTTIALHSYWML